MRVKDTTPTVVAVTPGSPAEKAGLRESDSIRSIDGIVPRDVIEWRMLTDGSEFVMEISRGGMSLDISVSKREGEPFGIEISSAVFDRVRTCDNHCPFCFIYQLPPGMRRSLYLKDDDYRLSFLYGNFTTLTRFTEADLERILEQGLSPINVSIHSVDPSLRSEMLRNRRGAFSLRWLKELLRSGVSVNGQIVVCPEVNDGDHLEETLIGILEEFPELSSVAVVPLGVSRFNSEASMRPHTPNEARRTIEIVHKWQEIFLASLGRRLVHAADEYYIMAEVPFPDAETYEGFHLHEDGIGMARTFELEFLGQKVNPTRPESGFFASVDGAPALGYRSPRNPASETGLRQTGSSDHPVRLRTRQLPDVNQPIAILTGEYGATVLRPLVETIDRTDVRILPVPNNFFGGNIGVTGLIVGEDLVSVLSQEPCNERYLLPDVCLSEGRFLDGMTPQDLPIPVEIVPTDGIALRKILERST